MNINAVKSFGLALMLAAGVLAVLLALGTFSPQKAAAQVSETADTVTVQPDSAAAGEAVVVTVGFQVRVGDAITAGQEVAIALPGFAVPGSIDASNISIRAGTAAGNPASVAVSGTTVTVEVGNDSGGVPMFVTGSKDGPAQVYVTFTKAAGIAAGGTAGNYYVTVNGQGAETGVNKFTISPSLSLSHSAGFTSTTLKVTGASFAAGTVAIYVESTGTKDASKLTGTPAAPSVTIAGGAFEATVPIAVGVGSDKFRYGDNYIYAKHSDVAAVPATAQKFALSAKVTAPAELVRGDTGVEITVEEGDVNATVDSVTIGGTTLTTIAPITGGDLKLTGGSTTVVITVDAAVKVGSDVTLAVKAGTTTLGSTTVNVASLTLTLSPSTAVQGNSVTLDGKGFTSGAEPTLTVGGNEITVSETVTATTGGRFVIPFTVGDLEGGKDHKVVLTGDGGRIGEGTLTVPAPTISINPTSNGLGDPVEVTGSNFPGNDPVFITYGGKQAGIANADGVGNWVAVITVPVSADPGDTAKVQAYRPAIEDSLKRESNEVTHTIPGSSLALSSTEAASGDIITITGQGYKPYNSVTIRFGASADASPAAQAHTNPDGSFSVDVQVPLFTPGSTQLLRIEVGGAGAAVTRVFRVLAPAPVLATRAIADVFADLIDAGALGNVARYDNVERTWQLYNPAAPGASDLETVEVFDALWVEVSADATFQDQAMTAGWNNVTVRR